jgi:hypothetical protein
LFVDGEYLKDRSDFDNRGLWDEWKSIY